MFGCLQRPRSPSRWRGIWTRVLYVYPISVYFLEEPDRFLCFKSVEMLSSRLVQLQLQDAMPCSVWAMRTNSVVALIDSWCINMLEVIRTSIIECKSS
jgi:hypothetical protein